MNILQKFFITSFALFGSLSCVYAAGEAQSLQEGMTTIGTLISSFTDTVLSAVVTLLMSLAILVFFWGVVEYIIGMREGNQDKVTKGNKFIMWGLVGLFVMFSVYGIIKFGQGIFGFKESDLKSITIPTINTGGGGSVAPSSGSGSTRTSPLDSSPSPSQTKICEAQVCVGTGCLGASCTVKSMNNGAGAPGTFESVNGKIVCCSLGRSSPLNNSSGVSPQASASSAKKKEGEVCQSSDDCQTGLSCKRVTGELYSLCSQ
jgi:hypothetical protein